MSAAIFRFAPSPNGDLHLGHALSALENERMAQAIGGTLLLRIEDIDTLRCRPALIDAMIHDLDWLGIRFAPHPRRQSQHFPEYAAALAQLEAMGVLYRCFASRSQIAQAATGDTDPDGAPLYPGLWRDAAPDAVADRLAANAPFAWRLDMAKAMALAGPLTWRELDEAGGAHDIPARPQDWGDVVLARKDTPASYHLAVVCDDASQGVTHVVRGRDLYHATAVHRLLQTLLDLPAPLYRHHRLILGPDGRKLSKSIGSTSLRALRADGATPDDIRRKVGFSARSGSATPAR